MSCHFRAYSRLDHRPIEVEIFLDNHVHGYTPSDPAKSLAFEIKGSTRWFAILGNRRIAQGMAHEGDEIELAIGEQGYSEIFVHT